MKNFSIIRKYHLEHNLNTCLFSNYCRFLYFRVKYKVGVDVFLKNRLFLKREHRAFLNTWHPYIHSWKYCIKKYIPNSSFFLRICYKMDFLVSKFIYHGLDAMDYFRYEFYNFRHSKRKTFITEGFLKKMNYHFNPVNIKTKYYYNVLDNKVEFNTFFADRIGREWICSKTTLSDFSSFCFGKKGVFVKPINGGGGSGSFAFTFSEKNTVGTLFNLIKDDDYIVEDLFIQSDVMASLSPSSVNTIRVYTIRNNDGVFIVSATLRFGNGESRVDNYSSGGFAATVDVNSGIVDSCGVTQNGEKVLKHPKTGTIILGFQIPNWENITKLTIESHNRIEYLRYIGWDVVLDKNNMPYLIEANTFAGVELQQHPGLIGKKPLYKRYW